MTDPPKAAIRILRRIRQNGLVPDFRRALHERLLLDKNLWSKRVGQIRPFLPPCPVPSRINRLAMTKTPGKTFAVLAGICHTEA